MTPLKDLRHCHANWGERYMYMYRPPQLMILNIFDVRPLIMLQMYRVIPQDYAGPTKKD